MRRFDASFPHPLLGVSDDVKGDFTASAKVNIDEEFCTVTVSYFTDNEYFKNLLNEGKIDFVLELDCPSTGFRKFYKTRKFNEEFEFAIPTQSVTHKVDVYYYVTAAGRFSYASDTFDSDYLEESFEITNGELLGYHGKTYFFIDKFDPTNEQTGSIITVTRSDSVKRPTFQYNGQKIEVYLPQELFDTFSQTHRSYSEIYLSVIALPALVGALIELKSGNDNSDYRWAQAINENIERNADLQSLIGNDNDIDFRFNEIYEAAQILLKDCYKITFRTLDKLNTAAVEEEYEL